MNYLFFTIKNTASIELCTVYMHMHGMCRYIVYKRVHVHVFILAPVVVLAVYR